MKLVRVLSRVALLSIAAAAVAGLTEIYGVSVRPPLPTPCFQAAHRHRPPEPDVGEVMDFVRYGLATAVFAVGGRVAFRLRLSPAPRGDDRPILLGLNHGNARTIKA